jgi:hypothetical protein
MSKIAMIKSYGNYYANTIGTIGLDAEGLYTSPTAVEEARRGHAAARTAALGSYAQYKNDMKPYYDRRIKAASGIRDNREAIEEEAYRLVEEELKKSNPDQTISKAMLQKILVSDSGRPMVAMKIGDEKRNRTLAELIVVSRNKGADGVPDEEKTRLAKREMELVLPFIKETYDMLNDELVPKLDYYSNLSDQELLAHYDELEKFSWFAQRASDMAKFKLDPGNENSSTFIDNFAAEKNKDKLILGFQSAILQALAQKARYIYYLQQAEQGIPLAEIMIYADMKRANRTTITQEELINLCNDQKKKHQNIIDKNFGFIKERKAALAKGSH